MIKAMFPNVKLEEYHNNYGDYMIFCLDAINHHQFELDWWNTPYKNGE